MEDEGLTTKETGDKYESEGRQLAREGSESTLIYLHNIKAMSRSPVASKKALCVRTLVRSG